MQIKSKLSHGGLPRLLAIVLGMVAIVVVHAKNNPNGSANADPDALDLASYEYVATGKTIAVSTLTTADASTILAAADISEETPPLDFSDDVYGCKTPSKACSQEHERKLIEADKASVRRDGKKLTIAPATGPAKLFVDWTLASTKTADGDEETHWYLGHVIGSNYYRVEAQFGHDAPGNFLINPTTGKMAFIHNGADVAAASPDGMQVVTFNTLNLPLNIRVASLGAAGPRLEMQCEARKGGKLDTAQFKGWHDPHSFDLAIEIHAERSKLVQKVATRFIQNAAQWSIATADAARLEAIGFACKLAN